MSRSMEQILGEMEPYLPTLDEITRSAHKKYRERDPIDHVEFSKRTERSVIYDYIVLDADKRFSITPDIVPLEVQQLKVWFFSRENVLVRFKRMDESSRTRNVETVQALAYDAQEELPNFPVAADRLTVGYILDRTGVNYVTTRIGRPQGKTWDWCVTIVSEDSRIEGMPIWENPQDQFAFR